MYVVLVEFCVNEDLADKFGQLVSQQAANSLSLESGCHRFDVAASTEDPARFLLYEIYEDRQAFDVHLESPHFKQFDADVADAVVSKQVTFWNLSK